MADHQITYNFEYARKLKVCFIGAGGHSFRNVYPTFQYAPIDLVAICDLDEQRASSYARQFGAKSYYTDYLKMFKEVKPDAVFIVAAYKKDGRVQATDIAMDAVNAGIHVWMEKPTAASTEEIKELIILSKEKKKFVMTGTKKVFFPAIQKVKEIISSPEFGSPSSIYIRYPQDMPAFENRTELTKITSLLDHIYHPGSIIHFLMGKIKNISYQWEPFNGGSVTNIQFISGAIGTLHLAAGASGSSPLERVEIIGEGANVIVDNGVKVTYYRRAQRPSYGRAPSYLVDDASAPLYWEPEFSLGQLYNKNIFYLGYVQEVLHFCESIFSNKPPQNGRLEDSMEIMKLYEAYRNHPSGKFIEINS